MIEPGEGLLACGYVGKGRMEEPDTIVDVVERFFRDRGAQPVALNEDKESAPQAYCMAKGGCHGRRHH